MRSFRRQKKLPESFVRELAEVSSSAQTTWARAREKNDFKLFLPALRKIIELKQKEAKYVGFTDSPYDALLETYEPGMSTVEVSKILNDLKDFLVPFLATLTKTAQKKTAKTHGHFPIDRQHAFNQSIAAKLGFDFGAGRLDKSTHPFTTNFHPNDVRITTRYREDDVLYSIPSTVHETGHALYEQGLMAEHFGTPLGESVSLGIHESQSRLWENMIGRSRPFWKHFYPILQKEFPVPFRKLTFDEFYRTQNVVTPSFIRTEADEVTYNLHIILRFEIEKELIEGSIDPVDLPKIWNAKMKQYLGIDVPSDREGVLQDVHWSAGLFGYFPTYSLGNLYAAQLWYQMQKEIPNLQKSIAAGKFADIREWLRVKIHRQGKAYSATELIKKITGEYPNSRYFSDYLREKYSGD
jgi:carboxypeptidase Taq